MREAEKILLPERFTPCDRAALALCVAALVTALIAGHFHLMGTYDVETDFYGIYSVQAKNILEGLPYSDRLHPPGYSLLLALASFLTDDFFIAGKLLSAVATALLGGVSYLLLKSLSSEPIALTATLMLLIALIPFSFLAATDVVGALAILTPLMILLRSQRPAWRIYFLAGLFSGLAYLIRFSSLFVIVSIALSLPVINLSKVSFKARGIQLLLFAAGVMIMTAPWFYYHWQVNGQLFSNESYVNVAAAYFGAGDDLGITLRQTGEKFTSLRDVIMHDPPAMMRQYLSNVFYRNGRLLAQGVLPFPLFLLALSGLPALFSGKRKKAVMAFLFVSISGYLFFGLVGFHLRFYLFLFPFLFFLVAAPLFHERVERMAGKFRRLPLRGIIVLALALLLSVNSWRESVNTIRQEPRQLLPVADFLRRHAAPGEPIIVRKPHLAHLAGLKALFPLERTWRGYLESARETGARFIVYNDYDALAWPGLRSLRNPRILPKEFKLLFMQESSGTLIYEIQPAGE